jgi:hypothetical protein
MITVFFYLFHSFLHSYFSFCRGVKNALATRSVSIRDYRTVLNNILTYALRFPMH